MQRRQFLGAAAAVAALPAGDASAEKDSTPDGPEPLAENTTRYYHVAESDEAITVIKSQLVVNEGLEGWSADVNLSVTNDDTPHLDLGLDAEKDNMEIGVLAQLDIEQARALRERLGEAIEVAEAARAQRDNKTDDER